MCVTKQGKSQSQTNGHQNNANDQHPYKSPGCSLIHIVLPCVVLFLYQSSGPSQSMSGTITEIPPPPMFSSIAVLASSAL